MRHTLSILTAISFTLTGCAAMLPLPKSEQQLMQKGKTATITANTDVITAYSNLKPFMEKCVAYNTPNGYFSVKATLDRQIPSATFVGYANGNNHLLKVALSPVNNNQTRIDYTIADLYGSQPKQKILNQYKYVAEHKVDPARPCKVGE